MWPVGEGETKGGEQKGQKSGGIEEQKGKRDHEGPLGEASLSEARDRKGTRRSVLRAG